MTNVQVTPECTLQWAWWWSSVAITFHDYISWGPTFSVNNFFLFGFLLVSAVLAQRGGGGLEGVSAGDLRVPRVRSVDKFSDSEWPSASRWVNFDLHYEKMSNSFPFDINWIKKSNNSNNSWRKQFAALPYLCDSHTRLSTGDQQFDRDSCGHRLRHNHSGQGLGLDPLQTDRRSGSGCPPGSGLREAWPGSDHLPPPPPH